MSELGAALFLTSPLVFAGISHMILVKKKVLPRLARPIDGGRLFRGAPIFGENKTWRGLLLMPLVTGLFFALQELSLSLAAVPRPIDPYHPGLTPAFLFGALLGLGYILGELPNSFTKRRLAVPAGASPKGRWRLASLFVDQADSVLGCLLAMLCLWTPPLSIFILTFVLGTAAHLLCNGALHVLRLKKKPAAVEAASEHDSADEKP